MNKIQRLLFSISGLLFVTFGLIIILPKANDPNRDAYVLVFIFACTVITGIHAIIEKIEVSR